MVLLLLVGRSLNLAIRMRSTNAFLAGLGNAAPIGSLEEIVAFNEDNAANQAPYGQDRLEASLNLELLLKSMKN